MPPAPLTPPRLQRVRGRRAAQRALIPIGEQALRHTAESMHGGPSAWTRAPDSDAITLADATLGATLRVRRDARIMGSAVMPASWGPP